MSELDIPDEAREALVQQADVDEAEIDELDADEEPSLFVHEFEPRS